MPKEYKDYIDNYIRDIENNLKIEIKDNDYKDKIKL